MGAVCQSGVVRRVFCCRSGERRGVASGSIYDLGRVSFFLLGILFGNVNAVAMEPVGHIAGFGSSVVGFVSGAISLSIGMLIGQMYTGTVLPLIGGFALLAPISILVMKWADKEVASVTDPV